MPGGNLGPHVTFEIGSGFDEIEILEPDGSLIRAGAGAVAAAVDREARARGRFLPFLPSSFEWCRVGGMLGTNAAGARSFRYGATAEWIEAVEGYFAWGEPFRVERGKAPEGPFAALAARLASTPLEVDGRTASWPSVRKNSSGYALDRFLPDGDSTSLLTGSEGTLAVFTRAELRTAPLPEATGLALFVAEAPEDLRTVAAAAESAEASACEFFGRRFLELGGTSGSFPTDTRDAWAVVLVEVSGSHDEVREGLDDLGALAGRLRPRMVTKDAATVERLWSLRHAASPTIARETADERLSTQFIEDSVVPVEALASYLHGLDRILKAARFDAVVFGHAGDANVHVNPLLDLREADWLPRARRVLDEVAELVSSLGGTLSGEHGDGRLRTPLVSRVWPARLVEAFNEVKTALDPRGILNPGVIVPLPGQDPFEGFAPRARAFPPLRPP